MPTYTIRTVIRWEAGWSPGQKNSYEERITAWNAESMEQAIDLAEEDAKRYAESIKGEALDLFQAFWLFEEIDSIPNGTEMFSLLRGSDLDSRAYIDAFFATGHEHQVEYDPPGD
ncbi:MAG: hypothetical protein KDM63_21510 [Verrucomicrobiae bacterium]|nr:hypothetical protein [Verrucomicrobiae bacterium]